MKVTSLLLICGTLFYVCPEAQPQEKSGSNYLTIPFIRIPTHKSANYDAQITPSCTNPPAPEQMKAFQFYKAMSVKDAVNLNLNFLAADAKGEFTQDSQSVVYRNGKTATCTSSDGKYLVTYGWEADAGVAISQTAINGSASYATIAANTQINNSSTLYANADIGYKDATAWESANVGVVKQMAGTLNVSSFDAFSKAWGTALDSIPKLVMPDKPAAIGYAPVGVVSISESLAAGYALMMIADNGRGCLDAVKTFPSKDDWVEPAIRKVYLQLSAGKSDCDGKALSNEPALAQQLLSGIKIVGK